MIEKLWPKLEWQGNCLVGREWAADGRYPSLNYKGEGGKWGKVQASRVIYASVYGWRSLDGLLVRHTCDYPPCLNIEHLVPGTHEDNTRDRFERGRYSTPTPDGALHWERLITA